MKPVVGRAPHPLLSSCACQCARLACSVKDCFEDPLCCCSGSFVATCLVQFSSSLQWLHKANSTSYATAVCLVRQLSRCSACFCSPLWVHEEAFDFLSQLLALLCMPLGRKARGQGQSGGQLVQQSPHGRFSWPLSVFGGVGLAKAMATLQLWSLTFVCLLPKDDKNWAFLASPSPGASLCLRSRKKWRALCAAPSIGGFSVPFNSASLFSNSFTGERTVSDNGP